MLETEEEWAVMRAWGLWITASIEAQAAETWTEKASAEKALADARAAWTKALLTKTLVARAE